MMIIMFKKKDENHDVDFQAAYMQRTHCVMNLFFVCYRNKLREKGKRYNQVEQLNGKFMDFR